MQAKEAIRQSFAAEIDLLKNLIIQSGSRAADVPKLELHVADLSSRLKKAESEIQKRKTGASHAEDLASVVEKLEGQLRREKEAARVLKGELEDAHGRAGELESRMAKMQVRSFS